MNQQTPTSGRELLDIGYGLRIGLNQDATWQIWAKSGCFNLVEIADFYRVVTLLERPFSEVEMVLNGYAEKMRSASRFPYWKVVGAGLAGQSDEWARLALEWYSHLDQGEQILLCDLLETVAHSKWASQKSRQLANRYASRVRVSQNSGKK